MKLGVSVSSAAHVAILTFGLLSLGAPKPLEVADVEALPIDIVPIEEFTQTIQGDKQADFTDKPAPAPTERPERNPEAENIGDSDQDTKPVADAKPDDIPVETGATAPEPAPKPEDNPEPAPKANEEPTPATELAALNNPAVPVSEPEAADQPEISELGEQFAKLPDAVPVPVVRPKPPRANTAKTKDRKKPEKPPTKSASKAAKSNETSNQDQIAALLNKQEAASGGAKSSGAQPSLGTLQSNGASKLSQSELDALRAAIQRCSTGLSGRQISQDLTVTVKMNLLPNGEIDGDPVAAAKGGTQEERRRYARDILRFVKRCAPYDLPPDKYDTWATVTPTFHPYEMFN